VKKYLAIIALVSSLALVAAACGGDEGGGTSGATGATGATGAATKGGVLRESLTSFGWTGGFDPTGEYLGLGWGWYQQMLIRGLLAYRSWPVSPATCRSRIWRRIAGRCRSTASPTPSR
jgi:hypothetical protein